MQESDGWREFELQVNNLAGPLCVISAHEAWTLQALRNAIEEATGIESALQSLYYEGLEMAGASSILTEFLPITSGDVLNITLAVVYDSFFVRLLYPYCCEADTIVSEETMTVAEAKERCQCLEGCVGFEIPRKEKYPDEAFEVIFLMRRTEEGKPFRLTYTSLGRSRVDRSRVDISGKATYLYIHTPTDREVLARFASEDGHRGVITHIQNPGMIRELVSANFFAFQHVCEGLRADPEIVTLAVQQNPETLQFATSSMHRNKEVVLVAVRQNGSALKYAHAELKAEKEIVIEAVSSEPGAYRFATKELQNDPDVALAACARRGVELQRFPLTMQANRDVVMAAVKQNGLALQWASSDLQADEEVATEAVRQNRGARKFASAALQTSIPWT